RRGRSRAGRAVHVGGSSGPRRRRRGAGRSAGGRWDAHAAGAGARERGAGAVPAGGGGRGWRGGGARGRGAGPGGGGGGGGGGAGMARWGRAGGVPEGDIRVDRASTSTRTNAKCAAGLLLPEGRRRVWVVTQPFHTRRAKRCFRRAGFEARAWRIEGG